MKKYFVVTLGVIAVIGIASMLMTIVLRSPDTHANLWNKLKPSYHKTPIALVGEPAVYNLSGLTPGLAVADRRQQVYLLSGCASCHGVDARGGVVGPPLSGISPETAVNVVRAGPYGMPSYPAAVLNDSDLEKLATYLAGLPSHTPSEAELATLLQITYNANLPTGTLLKGEVALNKNCGMCHEIPTKYPGDHSLNGGFDVGPLLADMVKNANTPLDDAILIGDYIMAVRNGVEPIQTPG